MRFSTQQPRTPGPYIGAKTAARVMLADIGGTNARFAIFEDGRVGEVGHFVVADHAGIEAVVTAYLAGHTQRPPEYAVLGVAGPVEVRARLNGVGRADAVRALVAAGVSVDQVGPRGRLEDAFLHMVGGEGA